MIVRCASTASCFYCWTSLLRLADSSGSIARPFGQPLLALLIAHRQACLAKAFNMRCSHKLGTHIANTLRFAPANASGAPQCEPIFNSFIAYNSLGLLASILDFAIELWSPKHCSHIDQLCNISRLQYRKKLHHQSSSQRLMVCLSYA